MSFKFELKRSIKKIVLIYWFQYKLLMRKLVLKCQVLAVKIEYFKYFNYKINS